MFGYGEILNPHYERDVPDPCPNCGGSKAVRNPTGSCDHLYWPDNLTPEAKRKVEQADALLRAIHASNS